jgi:hypothetical protein
VKVLFPLSDGIWGVFFRGMVFGFFGGLVLTLLFLWSSGKYGALAAVRPIGFVYFFAGLEVGIALIGAIVSLGLNALQGWGHRMVDQETRLVIATRFSGRFWIP